MLPAVRYGRVLISDSCKIGRGERIRTSGLYVPNVALYQAKLHPDYSSPLPLMVSVNRESA